MYTVVWVAIVFGNNSTSNAGRRIAIVQGTAEHYYNFLPTLQVPLIQNTIATHTVTNILSFLSMSVEEVCWVTEHVLQNETLEALGTLLAKLRIAAVLLSN